MMRGASVGRRVKDYKSGPRLESARVRVWLCRTNQLAAVDRPSRGAMNIEDIRTLYHYNRWANRRVCQAARLLDVRDFARDLRASHSSVRGTLVHIMWGEWLYF